MIDLRDLSVMRAPIGEAISNGRWLGHPETQRFWRALGETSMTKADRTVVAGDDDIVTVGRPLPRLVSVAALDDFKIQAAWNPETSARVSDIVDLSPVIERYRVYAPLRSDPTLFRAVRMQSHRYGIAWGRSGEIDMGACMIADLASQTHGADPRAASIANSST